MTDPRRRAILAGLAALPAAALLPRGLRAQEGPIALGAFTEGDPEAPVTIIEYLSLTCPHCATFHEQVHPELKREYIDTGKAKLEYREVYFDRVGLWAAMLARCGGERRYFGFVGLLLEKQSDWAVSDPEAVAAELVRMGRQGGLSDDDVRACLTDSEGQRALVEQYQEYREDPRLTGTPTLIVGGEKVDNPTFENLKAAIDAELGA